MAEEQSSRYLGSSVLAMPPLSHEHVENNLDLKKSDTLRCPKIAFADRDESDFTDQAATRKSLAMITGLVVTTINPTSLVVVFGTEGLQMAERRIF